MSTHKLFEPTIIDDRSLFWPRPTRDSESKLETESEIRKLVWSSARSDNWEILAYRSGELWEACFFLWGIHHEHLIGSSLEHVRRRAERRIAALEASRYIPVTWDDSFHSPSVDGRTF